MALHEIIGLGGVALMLAAYAALMAGRMSSERAVFHAMNLVGSLGVVYSLLHDWNLPTFCIEVAWSAVALWGLYKCAMRLCKRG